MSMKRPAAAVLVLEPVARSESEPGVRPDVEVEHLSEAIPAPVSEVGSLSPTPREEPAIAIPPSSSRRQGAPAKRVKRVRRDKKKSPINKIVEGQAESSVRPRSLPFHQSDVSSDDPFGEDEVDNVRLNDAEALRAASESNAVGCRLLRSPLHVSTGGALLVVLLRRAALPPILDAGSRRSVMTSSVGLTAVLSTSVQPMQELVQQGGLGDVWIISMFGNQSRSLVLGRQRKQVAETVKVFPSLHLPRRQTFSMETSTHPSQDQVLSM